jgi:hypothetical protein
MYAICIYILIYWLADVKGTNIFQELVHADVKNMSVKAVGNKNVPNCIVKPFISFTPSVSGTTL